VAFLPCTKSPRCIEFLGRTSEVLNLRCGETLGIGWRGICGLATRLVGTGVEGPLPNSSRCLRGNRPVVVVLSGRSLRARQNQFKAINTRDRNFTTSKVDKRQQQIEECIQRYLNALETPDRTRPPELEAKTSRLPTVHSRFRRAVDGDERQRLENGGLQRKSRSSRRTPPFRCP
jgi:hypothetical protein